MSVEVKTVMLIGAGGNVGAKVLPEFEGSGFTVSVLSRKESSSTFPAGIKVVKAEYTPEGLKEAFKGQDAVVSMVGSMVIEEQLKIADAALAAGVKWFFPSEFGSDLTNPEVVKEVPIFGGKVQVVKHLQESQDKMHWTAVINGAFYDWCLQVGFLDIDVPNKKAMLYDGGNSRFGTTTLASVGKTIVGALKHPAETTNRYIYVASFVTTQNEVLATVEKQLGTKFEVTHISSADVLKSSRAKLDQGDFSAIAPLIKASLYSGRNLGDYPANHKLANEVLGLPKETLEEETQKALKGMGAI
jgi:uncharacterized protein YbjT (DUF2867 family)